MPSAYVGRGSADRLGARRAEDVEHPRDRYHLDPALGEGNDQRPVTLDVVVPRDEVLRLPDGGGLEHHVVIRVAAEKQGASRVHDVGALAHP